MEIDSYTCPYCGLSDFLIKSPSIYNVVPLHEIQRPLNSLTVETFFDNARRYHQEIEFLCLNRYCIDCKLCLHRTEFDSVHEAPVFNENVFGDYQSIDEFLDKETYKFIMFTNYNGYEPAFGVNFDNINLKTACLRIQQNSFPVETILPPEYNNHGFFAASTSSEVLCANIFIPKKFKDIKWSPIVSNEREYTPQILPDFNLGTFFREDFYG